MIFAVIVTFNPQISNVVELVRNLKLSNVTPLIVDNGSDLSFSPMCETIFLKENLGIATAQNEGLKSALSLGAKYVVFFDQDSTITNCSFIYKLLEPLVKEEAYITAPIFVDKDRGFTYPIVDIRPSGRRVKYYPSSSDPNFKVSNVISSGTMVNATLFNEVGQMTDQLFIDYVDTEWCLRCASLGYYVTVVPSAIMYHSIGDSSFSLLGFNVPKHSPIRRYFRVRNSFFLLRKSYIPKLMSVREVLFSVVHQIILILASKGERRDYIKSLFKGCWDGLRGKFGAY